MKKCIIAVAAAFAMAWSANAQVGIVAGLTSSSNNIEQAYADAKNINQYHVGVTYKLGLGNLLAVQPSLIYNMKGTKMGNIAGAGDIASLEYKTGYLELPVQVQAGIGVLNLLRVYGFVEPFLGYAISNKVEGEALIGSTSESGWDNVKTKFEYGISLGAGVEVFKHLQVSVKYFWNLGNVYGADINIGSLTTELTSSKCSGVAASVAFLF